MLHLLPSNSPFFIPLCFLHLVLIHILYFGNIGYLSDQCFSFSVMPLSIAFSSSVSCLIPAIQAHEQPGKLCFADFCYLRADVQCLFGVSAPHFFSSWAARGGVGVGAAGPVGEDYFSVWVKQFSIFLLDHSTPDGTGVVICTCSPYVWRGGPSPPSWLSSMYTFSKLLGLFSKLLWMLLIPGSRGLPQQGAASFLRAST